MPVEVELRKIGVSGITKLCLKGCKISPEDLQKLLSEIAETLRYLSLINMDIFAGDFPCLPCLEKLDLSNSTCNEKLNSVKFPLLNH